MNVSTVNMLEGDSHPNGPQLAANLKKFCELVRNKIRKPESKITLEWIELSSYELKNFQEIELNINSWLSAREEFMKNLYPITTTALDPKWVHNQLGEVRAIKYEFDMNQPIRDLFDYVENTILDTAGTSPDGKNSENKFETINRKCSNLLTQLNKCQKELNNAKADLENTMRKEKEFKAQCTATLEWLQETEALLQTKFVVSADKNTLMNQVADFELVHKDIRTKGNDIITILNHGRNAMTESSETNPFNIDKSLEYIKKNWQEIKKTLDIRQARLYAASERCKQFYATQNKFWTFLKDSEEEQMLKNIIMTSSELKRQKVKLQTIMNNKNRRKHRSEFILDAKFFIAVCDTDEEIIKTLVHDMEMKGDKLDRLTSKRSTMLANLINFIEGAEDNMKRAKDKLKAADNPPKDSRLLNIMINDLYTEGEKLNEMFMSRDHNLIQSAKDLGDTTTINNLYEALCNLILKIDSKGLILHNHKDMNPTNTGGAERVSYVKTENLENTLENTKEISVSNLNQIYYEVQKIENQYGNSEHNTSELDNENPKESSSTVLHQNYTIQSYSDGNSIKPSDESTENETVQVKSTDTAEVLEFMPQTNPIKPVLDAIVERYTDISNPTVFPTLSNGVNPMNDPLSVFETKKTGTKLSKMIDYNMKLLKIR